MRSYSRIRNNRAQSLLLGTALAAGIVATAPAYAADADADNGVETVVVTGYRASLTAATDAKRASTNFTDSIFAEDIGKFPDTNIAESLNRIPGVTISREIDGEGVNVSIRGLGTNFTKVTLNNAAIAVASTGATDQRNNNREVDLNMFPTELFTQLTVSKSPTADQVEGRRGRRGEPAQRAALRQGGLPPHLQPARIGRLDRRRTRRARRGDPLRHLGRFRCPDRRRGRPQQRIRQGLGRRQCGWVGPSLATAASPSTPVQCSPAASCGTFGSKSWGVPGTIPTNVAIPIPGGGGATYAGRHADRPGVLLANNPGLTIGQISNALLPRLGRSMFESGTRDRYNAVASLEWRPDRRDALLCRRHLRAAVQRPEPFRHQFRRARRQRLAAADPDQHDDRAGLARSHQWRRRRGHGRHVLQRAIRAGSTSLPREGRLLQSQSGRRVAGQRPAMGRPAVQCDPQPLLPRLADRIPRDLPERRQCRRPRLRGTRGRRGGQLPQHARHGVPVDHHEHQPERSGQLSVEQRPREPPGRKALHRHRRRAFRREVR